MSPQIVLVIAAVCAASAVTLAATAVALPPTRRERMLRTLATFGVGRITDTRPAKQTMLGRLRPQLQRLIQRFGDVLARAFGARERLARRLDYAGNPPDWPLDRVIRARLVSAVVVALLGWWLTFILGQGNGLLGLLAGAVLGLFLPDLQLRNIGDKRQKELERSLPDVLDALVIGVEAGLGLDAALAQVAFMLRGPMPDEVRRVLQEMKLGVSRTDALRALSARTTVRDLKRLVTALVQAGELGISVAGILREHAAEQRVRRRQRAEEQAQQVAVKLLFPVLFCLFPVIFVVVLGPALINLIRGFG
ncbi:MAG: type II secretion system F family protein [Actinoplanes sp.]